ncbi:MAG: 16S rRNA (cytidine1402-2'-O)-methyltransferase [Parvicella sp.]|jgi:16S rRNA (cytidine1402-2'-O)-methyltransferase
MNSKAGNLYIVATPIGNLGDITYRAVDTLKKVDRILVEDTRHARTLLDHYAIRTPLQAFHDHNELKLIPTIMEALQQGESYAMISDAGTPLISDPGYKLVNQLQIAGIQALTVPGACAAIAALCVSGMATNRFAFEGFLPAKTAARLAALEMLKQEPRTLIFYEGKHRIIACLQSMAQVFGAQREVVVGRELTKKFETVVAGAFDDVIRQIGSSPENQKGEFVILVEGLKLVAEDVDIEKILTVLLEELSVKQASKLAAKLSGVSKNICYEKAVQLQQDK